MIKQTPYLVNEIMKIQLSRYSSNISDQIPNNYDNIKLESISLSPQQVLLTLWKNQLRDIENNLQSLYHVFMDFDPETLTYDDLHSPDDLSEIFDKLLKVFHKTIPKPSIVKEQYLIIYALFKESNKNKSSFSNEQKSYIKTLHTNYIQLINDITLINQQIRLALHMVSQEIESPYDYKYKLFNQPAEELVNYVSDILIHVIDKTYYRPTLVEDDEIIEDDWSLLHTTIK